MNNFVISEDLGTKLIAYLQERPFKEVAELIGGLIQLQKVNIIPSVVTPTTTEGGDTKNVQSETNSTQESNANGEQTKGQESNG
jgi:hypothetical protein